MSIDRFGYFIRAHCGFLYEFLERGMGAWVCFANRADIRRALGQSTISGTVDGKEARIRSLNLSDLNELERFFASLPNHYLKFFRPHGFDRVSLTAALKKQHYLLYGLFVENEMVGYGILKLFLGRKTFRGRLVSHAWSGRGLGHFLSRYMNWQVGLLHFRARSTISRKNLASLKSHEIEGHFTVINELPNDYMLIEFKSLEYSEPPELSINQKSK